MYRYVFAHVCGQRIARMLTLEILFGQCYIGLSYNIHQIRMQPIMDLVLTQKTEQFLHTLEQ